MTCVKTLFNTIVHGILPASTIIAVEFALDNMFTIVKSAGDTVTIKLHESVGGIVFDLKWHEELMQDDSGAFYIKVWDTFPAHVKAAIVEFTKENLPDSHFTHFLPSAECIDSIFSGAKSGASALADGKTITFAGKLFMINGFLPTLLISLLLKTLFRLVTDKQKVSAKKVAQDVLTATASTAAVFSTKFFIVAAFVHPPAAAVWVASAVVGIAFAKGVKMILKNKTVK